MPKMHCERYGVLRQCFSQRIVSKANADSIDVIYYHATKTLTSQYLTHSIDDIVYKTLKNFCNRPNQVEYQAILDLIVEGYKRTQKSNAYVIKKAVQKLLAVKFNIILNLELGIVLDTEDYAFICDHSPISISAKERIIK